MRLGVTATVREAPELLVLAWSGAAANVVVDCSETERCDAAALQVLLALRTEVLQRGRTFALTGIPAALYWRFAAVGLVDEAQDPITASRSAA